MHSRSQNTFHSLFTVTILYSIITDKFAGRKKKPKNKKTQKHGETATSL